MAWTEALISLQEIDQELETLKAKLADIQGKLGDQGSLEPTRREAERCAKHAEGARKTQKDLEFELQKTETQLKQTEQRLYSGQVTNPRELEDLQSKAQSLRRHRDKLENDLLEAMVVREEADEVNARAQARRAQEETSWQATQERLQEDKAQLTQRQQSLEADFTRHKQAIPESILDAYVYLKKRTGNIPVAKLKGEICSMCGVEVLKPTQQKISRQQEAYCDNCHRLLVI